MILGIPASMLVVLSVVAPTWLVYLGFESHILHLRNRRAYWVTGLCLMAFALLVRGDLAEFAHPLLGALMAAVPLLFGRGTLARRVTLSAFGLVIVLPGDLFLDMMFDILAGATIDDHATVAANATLFACATLLEVFVEMTLFWGAYRAGEKVLSGRRGGCGRAVVAPSVGHRLVVRGVLRGAGYAVGAVLRRGGGAVRRRFGGVALVRPDHAAVLRR